jgi:AraC family L-rhamnose operon regulatory protein RhaS
LKPDVAVFRHPDQKYYADSCEPLKQAAERGEVGLVAYGRGAYPGLPLPERSLQEVRSLGYWDADTQQSWGLDWHRNEGIEIAYVSRGKVRFSVDKEHYQLKRGSLTITRPWQIHRIGDPTISPCRLYWLILDVGVRRPNQSWRWPRWFISSEDDIKQLTTLLSHNEQPIWSANEEIERAFETMIDAAVQSNESRVKLSINALLIALTELLQRHDPPLDVSLSSAHRTVELFLASLPETVAHPWDLSSMAAACGLGRSRFAYYCREITNMSPIEYLLTCRIEVASRLLLEQQPQRITDIAFQCGFESSQYFNKVFRQYKNCTPREFKHHYGNRMEQLAVL